LRAAWPAPCLSLLISSAVVLFGTALVDAARLWLLAIPASFLIMAYAAGALVDRACGGLFGEAEHSHVIGLAVRVGVGLACLSLLAVSSAMCGVFWVSGVAALPLLVYGLLLALRAVFRFRPSCGILQETVGGLMMGGALLVAWLWATIPPTFFDELEYHLVIPQRVLVTGGLRAEPWVVFTLMPHASDLLLAWGMALGGDLGARATAFAVWVMCVLGVWGVADAIAWPRSAPWAAALVVVALATSPMFWFLATVPFAETGLTFAVVIAAVLLVAPQAERRPWLSLGLVLGLAASVKLSGLYWAAAALVAALAAGWPLRDVRRSLVIVVATIAPWWAWAYVHTGNPIYPLAYGLLGGLPWSEESQAKVQGALPYGTGGLGWEGLLRLPVDLVQHPERFGSASDAGVLAVAATCLLVILPAITRVFGGGAKECRLSGAATLFALVAGAGWIAVSPTARFFAPAMAIGLAVLVGVVLRLGQTAPVVALLLFLPVGIGGSARFINQHAAVFSSYDVALGRETADRYLAKQLDHFSAARFVRETIPPDARILFIGESRPYYFAREAMAPTAYDRHPLHRWVQESSSPKALADRLVAEGFTHVVLNVREFRRLHEGYGVLAFSGVDAEMNARRLKALPGALKLLFTSNGVYVFEIPHR
jgi:hypothetical protein